MDYLYITASILKVSTLYWSNKERKSRIETFGILNVGVVNVE